MDFLKNFLKKYLSLNKYQQARVVATIGTTIISLVILFILLNTYLRREVPQTEEGLEVMMGMELAGGEDLFEPTPASEIAQELEEVATSEPEPQPSEDAYQTQDLEESVEMKSKKTDEEIQKEKELAEQKKKEQEEKEAERKRLAEEKRLKEEQQRRQDSISAAIASRTKMLGGGGGNGTDANSKGKGGNSTGMNGNPFGNKDSNSTKGSSNTGNNNSFSLSGRSPVGKISLPTYTEQVEGKIVIAITVDMNGNVTNAQMQARGTTVDNAAVINAAIAAAKKTKFTAIKENKLQTGIITYDLILK
jgi:TonB family protein